MLRRGFGEDERNADQSRALVDVVCNRVVKPDYDIGALPYRPSAQDLTDYYLGTSDPSAANASACEEFARRIMGPREWEELSQRVLMWQDASDTKADGCNTKAVLAKVLGKMRHFPTVERVMDLLGEGAAEQYKMALEAIENNPSAFAEFPDDKTGKGWTVQSAERYAHILIYL